LEAAVSSGGEQIDDVLDCCIGTMIGSLKVRWPRFIEQNLRVAKWSLGRG
jgi:hypothetical protein